MLGQEAAGGLHLTDQDAGRIGVTLGWAASRTLAVGDLAELLAGGLEREPSQAQRAELQILLGALYDRSDFRAARSRALFRRAVENATGRPDLRRGRVDSLARRAVTQPRQRCP